MDYRTRANLRDLLAKWYYFNPDIVRVVTTVGLEPHSIAWDARPVNTWHSVLLEAEGHGKVKDIIAFARKEQPANTSLELAERNLLLAVQTPILEDSAWRGPTDADTLEKITGAMSTLRPIGFLLRGFEVGKSVARVVLGEGVDKGSSGSGFLIPGNILITNNHVLPTKDAARTAKIEFNYQKTPGGLDAEVDRYELDPDAVFATSPEQGGDDWTAVRVKGDPSGRWGELPLVALPDGAPKQGNEVIIIQHPGGGQKQIALSHNTVAYADGRRLQYLTDTTEGSSGSPVFDVEWRVVGLHHAGGWISQPDSKQKSYRNQGIHINRVIEGLAEQGLM